MHPRMLWQLRARPQASSSFIQPLLSHTNDQNPQEDEETRSSDGSGPTKKVMIRIKSDPSESIGDDESVSVQQEDPLACVQSHICLAPSKPSATALIYLLYAADFAIGGYLIINSLIQRDNNENDYSYLMLCLTSGLLLLSGSLAGICLHTPLSKLLCAGDDHMDRSLMIFNTSFAFIGVGVYYTMGLSILTAPLFSKSLDDTSNAQIGLQCMLSLLVFSLSVLEGYRILYIQYHFHHGNQRETETSSTAGRQGAV